MWRITHVYVSCVKDCSCICKVYEGLLMYIQAVWRIAHVYASCVKDCSCICKVCKGLLMYIQAVWRIAHVKAYICKVCKGLFMYVHVIAGFVNAYACCVKDLYKYIHAGICICCYVKWMLRLLWSMILSWPMLWYSGMSAFVIWLGTSPLSLVTDSAWQITCSL